jgi:pimeloyl-ACP methyl ester carboxylesterase
MAYSVSGEGSPLILMHGWGCNSSTVASIAAVASESHRVYNIDFPGFGGSEEPADVWGVEEYTRAVEEFASKLGIENPVLAGHSFGGRVGILFASRNRVSKLILIDAAGVKPRRKPGYYAKVWSFKAMKMIYRLVLGQEKAALRIERERARRGSADYASASPKMRSILSKVVNEDLKAVMPAIKAPTLLVWGENDTATPLGDAKTMERLIPDAGLVAFAGCGHYSFLDNPSGFAAVLRSFLKS